MARLRVAAPVYPSSCNEACQRVIGEWRSLCYLGTELTSTYLKPDILYELPPSRCYLDIEDLFDRIHREPTIGTQKSIHSLPKQVINEVVADAGIPYTSTVETVLPCFLESLVVTSIQVLRWPNDGCHLKIARDGVTERSSSDTPHLFQGFVPTVITVVPIGLPPNHPGVAIVRRTPLAAMESQYAILATLRASYGTALET